MDPVSAVAAWVFALLGIAAVVFVARQRVPSSAMLNPAARRRGTNV